MKESCLTTYVKRIKIMLSRFLKSNYTNVILLWKHLMHFAELKYYSYVALASW